MARFALALPFLALHGALLAGVPVAPATPQDIAAAREALSKAFSSSEALRGTALPVDHVGIGPRLWAATAAARKTFAADIKDAYAIIPSAEIVTAWKLSPIDLDTIDNPTLRSILTEGAKRGTPVLAGAIVKRGRTILPALVLDQVETSDFPFTVRAPTEAELQYYYSLIPYDLSDPILVVEGGGHAFLCDFEDLEKGTTLLYFEML